MSLTIDPIVHWTFVAAVGLGLAAFSYWTYRPGTPARWSLLTLRFLALLVLVFVMLRPSLVVQSQEKLSSTLVFAVDKSRSMAQADETAGRTRFDALCFDLDQANSRLDRLGEKVRLRWFEFGSSTRASTREEVQKTAPKDDRTSIGDGLADIQERLAGERLAGVILLSDGANTSGRSPLQAARPYKSQRVPIHSVGYGQEVVGREARDVIARSIRTNPTVFAKNRLTATGEFDVAGLGNTPVEVRLLLDGKEQGTETIRPEEGAERIIANLSAVPLAAGDVKVTLEATAQGERIDSNNSVSTWVTVLAGGISVLQIEGKYRFWETKFVRWALDQSSDIELTQLFLLDQEGTLTDIPDEYLEPGRVDVYILGDIAASQISPAKLERLVELVRDRGAGLLMMGGYDAFGPGGWEKTVLSAIAPVQMAPTNLQRTGDIQMEPTDAGLRHFILRLAADPEANRQAWQSLRPLDGASSWSGLKPAAQLLAQSSTGEQLLAAQTVGAGRTIAFAGDTTWRWRSNREGIAWHARFWRQLILWLARKEDSGDDRIKVQLPTRRVLVGQSLPVNVRVESAEGSPLTGAAVDARVVTADGQKIPLELFEQDGEFRGTFWKSDAPGDLTLEVSAHEGEREIGTSTVKFLVYSEDVESHQPAADLEQLQSIAALTGGQARRHLELNDLLDDIEAAPLNLAVSQPIVHSLYDRWETLLVFIAILTAEWVLRKRRGLV